MFILIPPIQVARNAQKALNRRAELPKTQKGLTATGHKRAKQLAMREPLTVKDLKVMNAWFARHYVTSFQSPHYRKKQNAWIAWHAWGGTEGMNWIRDKLKELRKIK